MAKKNEPQPQEADYVVVGAGSAGSAVAARLARPGNSVVLLEAGKPDTSFLVRKPGMISVMHTVPELEEKFDWGYYTTPQQHMLGRQVPQTRGKVVGGSSSVNGMLWTRGNRANYDAWAEAGNKGWDAASVNEIYKRIEDFEDGENDYRGAGGPIPVQRHTTQTTASVTFREATARTLGVAQLDDYNAAGQEGVAAFQQSAHGGVRYSASRGYITEQHLPTLQVQSQVHVARVLVEGGRARGVELIDADGSRRTVRAGREVILSAGVFGSPQLLMLSGIGHADHLTSLGLPVHADLPVGDNLHDHLFVPMTFDMPTARHSGKASYFARGLARELIRGGSFLANSVFESVAFVRTSLARDVPDLQLHALPWSYPSPNQDAPGRPDVDPRPSLTVMSTLIYPRSRGTVRLASADPTAAPLIDFDYLAEPEDRQTLVEGCRMIREIMASPVFGNDVKSEIHPGPAYSDDVLDAEVLNRATTVYHGVGSCRMGVDETAVVGPDLRVPGVEGLRVADASIMPDITGGNTNAPSIMIGEKAAEMILND